MDRGKKVLPIEKRPARFQKQIHQPKPQYQFIRQDLPQPQKSALKSLSCLTAHIINSSAPKKNKATSSNTFVTLINNFLFKQYVFRAKKSGVTDQQIDIELRNFAQLREFMPPAENKDYSYLYSTKKSQSVKIEPKCDEIRKYVINFNPNEVFELEPQMQRQVLQGWLEYQRGKVLGLSEDFEQNAYKAQIGIERIQESVKGRH